MNGGISQMSGLVQMNIYQSLTLFHIGVAADAERKGLYVSTVFWKSFQGWPLGKLLLVISFLLPNCEEGSSAHWIEYQFGIEYF